MCMGLMYGNGPLGKKPAGTFNFEPPEPGQAVYLEPTPKRVRVIVGGETVADSRHAFLLQESGLQPVYYFPPRDVRSDLLEPTDRVTHCPKKGDASYYTIRAGDKVVENGAWYYPSPIESAPPELEGLIAFYFDRMDQWLEEAEEITVHPRDPYHRIDVIPSDSHIRISRHGQVLAETDHALALFESNLPVRWYLPREDVLVDLEPSDRVTHCPYKGAAGYYSAAVEGGKDLVWHYAEPRPEVGAIAGLLCFWNERVDVEVDGAPLVEPALARSG